MILMKLVLSKGGNHKGLFLKEIISVPQFRCLGFKIQYNIQGHISESNTVVYNGTVIVLSLQQTENDNDQILFE